MKTSLRIYILSLMLALTLHGSARLHNIVINELMAANVSYMLDDTYNYGGWVELYNNSPKAINLAGYSLSDDASLPRKYILPANTGTLQPNAYKIIFFDNNELNASHVNFKLDCDGATLYLYDEKGVSVDHVEYSYAFPEVSYARKGDASEEWGTCITPTPGATNDDSEFSVKRAGKPRVNTPAGLYADNIMVELSSDGGTIKYTTDGSIPDNRSAVWDGRMYIGRTTVLRARTFKKGCIPSEIFTATYIIDKKREITLPVISIATNPENLWSDSIGIYCVGTNGITGNGVSYPANWNCDWRRPANVEIINNPRDGYFSQQCDIAIGGGYSRSYPEKSIELNAEKKYEGRNSFDVRLFAQKPYYRFKSLNLRNSGNDFYSSMCRDAFQQSIYAGTVDIDYQAYQPAIHFINGEYYGIINIRERSNQHHVYSNWGYEKEEIDLVHNSASGGVALGDKVALNRLLELIDAGVTDRSYKEICTLLDVDEYINYIVAQSFSGNSDWMSNNVKFYRKRDGGGYRWVLFDLDHGFSSLSYNQFTATDRSGLSNVSVPTGRIYQGLVKYAPFREKFLAHATAVIGGTMREERVQAIMDNISAQITDETPYHTKRWGTGYDLAWQCRQYVNFAKERKEIYVNQLAEFFSLGDPSNIVIAPGAKTALYIDGVEVPTGVFDGYVNKGKKYRLSVDVPYGYKFSNWVVAAGKKPEEQKEYGPNYTDTILDFTAVTDAYTITPRFVRIDTLYGHLVPAVRINELGANKELVRNDYFEKSDWIELYNRTDSVINIAGMYISNSEENPKLHRFPDTYPGMTRIAPHSSIILWADEEPSRRELHLPFKLPSSGGRIILSAYADDDRTLLWRDELVYTSHPDDRTFGRYPDGGERLYIMHRPTPGSTNLYSSYNKFVVSDTVTGYHLSDVTSIASVEEGAVVISEKYYNLEGKEVSYDELPCGVYIRRTLYEDGRVVSGKFIKKY